MAADPLPVYCIDTSSLVHAWRRAYPPKRFAGLWAALDALIEAGRLVATIEVFHELKKKDDDIFAWAKERKEAMFLEIDDDVQDEVVRIMQAYPKLVDTGKGKSGGDPFVIAQALAGDPVLVVVIQEAGGSADKPRIPYPSGEVEAGSLSGQFSRLNSKVGVAPHGFLTMPVTRRNHCGQRVGFAQPEPLDGRPVDPHEDAVNL